MSFSFSLAYTYNYLLSVYILSSYVHIPICTNLSVPTYFPKNFPIRESYVITISDVK